MSCVTIRLTLDLCSEGSEQILVAQQPSELKTSIADVWRIAKAEASHDLHKLEHHQAGGCTLPSIAAQKPGSGQ